MSSEEPQEVIPKGESLVKHCPMCGVESVDIAPTNRWLKCGSCDKVYQVKTKGSD